MAVGQPYYYVASVWSFGDRSTTIAAGTSRYLTAPGGAGLTTDLAAVVALHAGTLKNLRWSCAASNLTGTGHRITLYVNGAATLLQATWSGGATSGSGTPDFIPVAPGDTFSVHIQLAGGTSMNRPRVSVELELPSSMPWRSNGADMYYDDGGRVGIGTDSPGEALSVNGTIEAMSGGVRFPDGTLQQTAFAMPPGSVIAFAGSVSPTGWLLCDGSLVGRLAFPELFAAIGVAHGEGDGSTTFALPDYRGTFLRGVSGTSGVDMDAAERTAQSTGANVGNAVGSRQWHDMVRHDHPMGTGSADSFTMAPGGVTGRLAHFIDDMYNQKKYHSTHVFPFYGGNETRPVNAYVHFLIKT